MNARLTALAERLDALAPKERVLLLVAATLLLVMLWHSGLQQPLALQRARLQAEATQIRTRLAGIEAEATRILTAAATDPDVALEAELASIREQTAKHEARIRERAGELVEPTEMAAILRTVLEQTRGLEFVGLEGLGAEPLVARKKGAEVDEDAPRAFRHGFRIRFKGSYLDTLAYLRALEALPWRFFWDGVSIDVTEHPQARASIVVYTLSLDRRWIGV